MSETERIITFAISHLPSKFDVEEFREHMSRYLSEIRSFRHFVGYDDDTLTHPDSITDEQLEEFV